jgi:hypothetical protein
MSNLFDEGQTSDATAVAQVDVNLDEIFGMPGAENIMLPDNEEEKKTMLSNTNTVDVTFIDKPSSVSTPEEKKEVEEVIAQLDDMISQEEDSGNKGRPKLDKSGLYELAQKMIEDGALAAFEDDKPLEEYTTKDFRELFEANFQDRENKVKENTPREFFNALPEELQYAAKYVADGGQDLKGLFKTLAQVEEMRQLDPTDERDQGEIARQYLHATRFGTAEEIESEIEDWRDMDKLEQKANQFKPKLDRMHEEIIARQLAEQEQKKDQQERASRAYMDNVYNTLSVGELGGIKLDKKTQSSLYSGLVQPNYPSISGKPTNLLGHLLEKYQFVEPRHDLIAKALWLLADPEGFESKIREQGSRAANEKTVRQLKTEESKKLTSSSPSDDEPATRRTSQRTLQKNPGNIFRRF